MLANMHRQTFGGDFFKKRLLATFFFLFSGLFLVAAAEVLLVQLSAYHLLTSFSNSTKGQEPLQYDRQKEQHQGRGADQVHRPPKSGPPRGDHGDEGLAAGRHLPRPALHEQHHQPAVLWRPATRSH